MTAHFSPDKLPNRFDHKEAEPRLYRMWEQRGCFCSDPDPQRKPFTIVIPPPNVTGALHLGHALNNTLQDILIRARRMQGFNALWMPGTDHAGIATQAVVERRLLEEEGKSRHDLGRDELVRRIWAWKDAYEARILSQLKQMGASCDWRRTRFTLDETCARAVRQTFFDLFRKQRIYRGKRLVNWDTFLQTAVSDDEVFHEPVEGHFWHFRYPVLEPKPGEPTHVTLATTRPETMLGDTAVAVHPDPEAALAEAELQLRDKLRSAPARERADLERQLADIASCRETRLSHLLTLRDMARAGRMVQLPLVNRPIPLIADPWAKPEMGSGCVKITPAHDPNDYEVGLRCGLPMINILNPDGTLNANAGPYQGQTVAEARKRVVADMDRRGLLAGVEDREIDLAHSDRSKTPIEPYLADQWFVRMDQLAQSAMDAVRDGRVAIVPERYARGYLDWLSEKRDWPVSRQLWWGHRIPVWSLQGPNDPAFWSRLNLPHIPRVDLESEMQAIAPKWADHLAARFVLSEDDNQRTLFTCIGPGCDGIERQLEELGFRQEEDVLDTWFSSALWPHSTLGWPEKTPELDYYYPTSTLITSRDIITLWVARMVLASLNNTGEVPFHEVYIHPKILDGYGETMSKSKGNGVDPIDIVEKFGADALRFGLAYLTTQTQDVRMPVQFECPHCQALIDQTRQNRERPTVRCAKCNQPFSTQWATKDEDRALPRAAVVSERFELARNFGNKLWNVSRLALIHLDGYRAAPVHDDQLAFEDRWILSRQAAVTSSVTRALDEYRFAEAARTLYDFAWDEFCSCYAEMVKPRLTDADTRPTAQRVLAHVLDTLMRLLHPMIPFLTEEVWQLLGQVAAERGVPSPARAADVIAGAPWPKADTSRQDSDLEARFARFQSVLGALREIRSRQGIAPKQPIRFLVRCSPQDVQLLEPMAPYFQFMARATALGWGVDRQPPATHAHITTMGMDVYVDLGELIDVGAELARNEKQRQKLLDLIGAKEQKLRNASFTQRAPSEVVERERANLADLRNQLAAVESALARLRT